MENILLSNNEKDIIKGLHASYTTSQKYSFRFIAKIKNLQEEFFERKKIDDLNYIKYCHYYLDATLYKFFLFDMSLEQLWALSMKTRSKVFNALEISLNRLDISKEDNYLVSYALEHLLFQTIAFIDLYMLYISIFLKMNSQGSMKRSRFMKLINQFSLNDSSGKSELIKKYFEENVFNTKDKQILNKNWGLLVESLRDKIAHKDIIRPSFEGNETILDKVLLNWPTIQGLTIERFCQEIQNNSFYLLKNSSIFLYETLWPQ